MGRPPRIFSPLRRKRQVVGLVLEDVPRRPPTTVVAGLLARRPVKQGRVGRVVRGRLVRPPP